MKMSLFERETNFCSRHFSNNNNYIIFLDMEAQNPTSVNIRFTLHTLVPTGTGQFQQLLGSDKSPSLGCFRLNLENGTVFRKNEKMAF